MINGGKVQGKLTPILGETEARLLTSLAMSVDRGVMEATENFLPIDMIRAVAVLYGCVLSTANRQAERKGITDEERAKVVEARTQMLAIVDTLAKIEETEILAEEAATGALTKEELDALINELSGAEAKVSE